MSQKLPAGNHKLLNYSLTKFTIFGVVRIRTIQYFTERLELRVDEKKLKNSRGW